MGEGREFHLYDLVATLRYILWNDRGAPQATGKDLSKATAAYVDRLRRAGIGPV